MKPKFKLTLAVAVLVSAGCLGLSKPVQLSAEASEEESSLVSSYEEEPIQSEGEASHAWEDIEIDGKTLREWKSELADETTRKSAIIALVEFVGFAIVMLLSKLLSHKDILANKSNLAKTAKLLEILDQYNVDSKKYLGEAKEMYAKVEAKMGEYKESSKADTKEAMAEVEAELEALKNVLLVLLKNTPDFINQDAYKQAMEVLDGKEKEE